MDTKVKVGDSIQWESVVGEHKGKVIEIGNENIVVELMSYKSSQGRIVIKLKKDRIGNLKLKVDGHIGNGV